MYINIHRVDELPSNPKPRHGYAVNTGPDTFELVLVSKKGEFVKTLSGSDGAAGASAYPTAPTFADLAGLTIPDDTLVYVDDASDDPKVTSGSAVYSYHKIPDAFILLTSDHTEVPSEIYQVPTIADIAGLPATGLAYVYVDDASDHANVVTGGASFVYNAVGPTLTLISSVETLAEASILALNNGYTPTPTVAAYTDLVALSAELNMDLLVHVKDATGSPEGVVGPAVYFYNATADDFTLTGHVSSETHAHIEAVHDNLGVPAKTGTITSRNLLAASLMVNTIVFVVDASDDPDVDTGGATYLYDVTAGGWILMSTVAHPVAPVVAQDEDVYAVNSILDRDQLPTTSDFVVRVENTAADPDIGGSPATYLYTASTGIFSIIAVEDALIPNRVDITDTEVLADWDAL